MNRGKICIVATNEFDAFAGSEVLWAETAAKLVSSEVEVALNVPCWGRVPDRIQILKDLKGLSFETRPTTAPLTRRLISKAGGPSVDDYFRDYRKNYLIRIQPDLVVISQGGLTDGIGWMEACDDLSVPFVAIVHLVADALWPSPEAITRASVVFQRAKQMFFVSEHNRALATRQLGLNFSESPIVRNPFNVDYYTAPSWPEPTGEWHLACVGRLGAEHKGQDLIIEVLSNPKWRERPLSVTLFGQGHHRSLLQRLLIHHGAENVRFGGYTHGITELWRNHHALIMPSRYEGLPIALVEAMLCHRMAIVTDVGGNTELVEDEVSGFVAASPSIRAVDDALERAWQRRDEWQAMGQSARKKVLETIPVDPVGVFAQQLIS